MKNLICIVGLLCVVLLGIIDTGFAQSFSVQRVGDGKQAIILISGFACSGEVWKHTVDNLQNNFALNWFVLRPRIIRKRNRKSNESVKYIESHREQLLE
ncbi:hypothetical protein [Bacteroides ilei]|uniref:hypothetical protein n=1 Tax=Bacteroides ilei TaxID=1907658 RepID=UPI0019551906|nr:hypothetical protein [Bacteroides ilei]